MIDREIGIGEQMAEVDSARAGVDRAMELLDAMRAGLEVRYARRIAKLEADRDNLLRAMVNLGASIHWLRGNYPRAFAAMPRDLFAYFDAANDAIKSAKLTTDEQNTLWSWSKRDG